MTNPMGHQIPSPEKPRVPYIPNMPGDVGQILNLDANAQPAWADLVGDVLPTGLDRGDVLTEDNAGALVWDSSYLRNLGLVLGSGVPPYTLSLSPFQHTYRSKIQLETPTVALWALRILPPADTYDYVQYLTSPPLAAAATIVVSGGAQIAMPALTVVNPTFLTLEIELTTLLFTWDFVISAFAENAVGDIEQIHVRGRGTRSTVPTEIVIDGPMSVAGYIAITTGA